MQPDQEYASELTQEQLDKSAQDGVQLFEEVLEQAEELAEDDSSDYRAILFAVWIGLIHELVNTGWKPEDLAKDVLLHGRMETDPESGNA